MADVDAIVISKTLVDEATGDTVLLQTLQDSVTKYHTLKVEATGVTFDGTLDPTNLALEAGNLATLVALLTPPTLGTVLKVAVAATHAESAAVGVTQLLLFSTTNCHIAIADAPVATSSSAYLPAGVYLRVTCATTNKVSVIRDTADGSLYITAVS